MRSSSLAAIVAVSSSLLGVFAGPVAKRQQTSSSSSSAQPSEALAVSTMSDGKPTTFAASFPTSSAASSDAASSAAATVTGSTVKNVPSTTAAESTATNTLVPSKDFPVCHDTSAAPFCLPNNESTLYVGSTYYITWNADFFPVNSTVTVKLNYANSSAEQAWSSSTVDNSWGVTTIKMDKAWLQGYSRYNLTFYALMFNGNEPSQKAVAYDGPTITLMNAPANHYQAPEHTKAPNKLGLMIGLPVSLGFVALVVLGLCLGMRKHRQIGLGNIMGRRKKGYGAGKSRRQRMGLGSKKGAIRLQERDIASGPQYRDAPAHGRDNSLGSLVSDDGIRPAPREGNAFRDEVQRQRTGR